MARYFTPTPSQYVSQFVPPNLELMYKVGQEQAANDSALLDNLDKSESELTVKGGMYTDKEHAAQINKNIKDNLTQIRDAFYSGKVDSFQAARAMNRLKNEVANDKAYNLYKLDEAYTKSASNQIASGKWNNALGVRRNGVNVFDARNGQMSINYKINPNAETEESLAELYNVQGAGEFVKEHAEIYAQIKPLINEKISGAYDGYKIFIDPNTKMPIFQDKNGKNITSEIKRNIIEPMMRNYAYENYGALDKPSVEYMRRSGENEEDYTKRLLDSFIGYGVYDKEYGNSNYSPLSTGAGEEKNKKSGIDASVQGQGNPVKKEVTNGSDIKSRYLGFLGKKDPIKAAEFKKNVSKSGGTAIINPYEYELSWKDLEENDKKVLAQFYEMLGENNPAAIGFAKSIKAGKDVSSYKYKNINNLPSLNEAMQQIIDSGYLDKLNNLEILTNDVVQDDVDYDALGIPTTNGAATLQGLFQSKLASGNPAIISEENKSQIRDKKGLEAIAKDAGYTPTEYKEVPISIVPVSPDNSLAMFAKDDEPWGNAIKLSVLAKDGTTKNYYIKGIKYTSDNPDLAQSLEQFHSRNEFINQIEQLKYKMPGSYVTDSNGTKIRYDEESKLFIDSKGRRYINSYLDTE